MLRAALARIAPFAALLAIGSGVGAIVVACGTDAVGVDACRQVEEARCNQAPNCASEISLSEPLHPGGAAGDVAACIRFYDDACLHGLATGTAPGQPAVTACVAAINAEAEDGGGGCDIVLHPEEAGACAWLIPPADVVDASDADGSDGSDDTGDDGG
jgi:hypothetical protein